MFRKRQRCFKNARTKGELQEISKPPKPVYNGNVFTTGKYDTEEEELLVWSLTCLQAPLNNQAYERYKELFCRLLPEKAKILFPEMNENNQAKSCLKNEEWRMDMTIREAGKGIVTTGGGTYRIGFINMDGQEDETELDAYNMTELEELYRDFYKENGFRQNTVTYVER